MDSRVALITGANGGIGSAIARNLLESSESTKVYLAVRNNRAVAEILANDFPVRAQLIDLEVTNPESWTAAIDQIVEKEGRFDILVNNAGGHRDSLLAMMPTEDWQMTIQTNLDAVFHGCQAVIKPMMENRFGRIVNVASLSAIMAPLGQTNYSAAKAGVVALTQSLAKEVARSGITANTICPGYIETSAVSGMSPEEKKAKKAQIPMRRFGKPEEVAAAVTFLASDAASYVTGSTLKIDGGIF